MGRYACVEFSGGVCSLREPPGRACGFIWTTSNCHRPTGTSAYRTYGLFPVFYPRLFQRSADSGHVCMIPHPCGPLAPPRSYPVYRKDPGRDNATRVLDFKASAG
ncbi:hypothetical protein NSK11_contig00069-0027 [Nocardia seriolae]|uniref:Uncharacterized protein n=1 Tax=Nocardia seriolae TaxID=37332 RepID=A0ABC9YY06_9NOCA|nr:hypothetical protein NSK11_contig00069-0027 [Nocardia seriolae]